MKICQNVNVWIVCLMGCLVKWSDVIYIIILSHLFVDFRSTRLPRSSKSLQRFPWNMTVRECWENCNDSTISFKSDHGFRTVNSDRVTGEQLRGEPGTEQPDQHILSTESWDGATARFGDHSRSTFSPSVSVCFFCMIFSSAQFSCAVFLLLCHDLWNWRRPDEYV